MNTMKSQSNPHLRLLTLAATLSFAALPFTAPAEAGSKQASANLVHESEWAELEYRTIRVRKIEK